MPQLVICKNSSVSLTWIAASSFSIMPTGKRRANFAGTRGAGANFFDFFGCQPPKSVVMVVLASFDCRVKTGAFRAKRNSLEKQAFSDFQTYGPDMGTGESGQPRGVSNS